MTTNNSSAVWNRLHQFYQNQDWIDKPNIFAQQTTPYLPDKARILELGAGQGQDSRFFASYGHDVVSTDISEEVLNINRAKLPEELTKQVIITQLDAREEFPFPENSFDCVYAHLSIHYFTSGQTAKVFKEILRVLKPGGILAMLNNSTSDSEYSTGKEIEPDYFQIGDMRKRFFSVSSIKPLVKEFETILLDNQGETYKDAAKGVHGLIRFIGRKLAQRN